MENGRYIITENFIFDVINKFNFKWIEKQIDNGNIIQLLMFIIKIHQH